MEIINTNETFNILCYVIPALAGLLSLIPTVKIVRRMAKREKIWDQVIDGYDAVCIIVALALLLLNVWKFRAPGPQNIISITAGVILFVLVLLNYYAKWHKLSEFADSLVDNEPHKPFIEPKDITKNKE